MWKNGDEIVVENPFGISKIHSRLRRNEASDEDTRHNMNIIHIGKQRTKPLTSTYGTCKQLNV